MAKREGIPPPRSRLKPKRVVGGIVNSLQSIRETIGISQREMADDLGTSQGVVSLWERGNGLTLEWALKIAKYLKRRVEDIWQLKPTEEKGK